MSTLVWAIKNPPSIATGGLPKPLCAFLHYTVCPSEKPKRYSRHSLMLLINICLLSSFILFVLLSLLQLQYSMCCLICQQLYLSFSKKVSLFSGFFGYSSQPLEPRRRTSLVSVVHTIQYHPLGCMAVTRQGFPSMILVSFGIIVLS